MKKLILIVICLSAGTAFGQTSYFVDCKRLETINDFTSSITSKLPEYHLVKVDSSNKKSWEFDFRNNENDDLSFVYNLQVIGGNPQLKIPPVYGIANISINGQFLTMAKIYNGIFDKNYTPEEIQAKKTLSTSITKTEGCNYFFIFSQDYRWQMLFRKM